MPKSLNYDLHVSFIDTKPNSVVFPGKQLSLNLQLIECYLTATKFEAMSYGIESSPNPH